MPYLSTIPIPHPKDNRGSQRLVYASRNSMYIQPCAFSSCTWYYIPTALQHFLHSILCVYTYPVYILYVAFLILNECIGFWFRLLNVSNKYPYGLKSYFQLLVITN